MAMEFTYKVSGIKVYSVETTGVKMKDIIKEATLHVIGTKDGQTYENFLPIELEEPSGSFKEFQDISESQVVEWLKNTHGEDHIQAMKEGMESMHHDSNNPFKTTRLNPEEKELVK